MILQQLLKLCLLALFICSCIIFLISEIQASKHGHGRGYSGKICYIILNKVLDTLLSRALELVNKLDCFCQFSTNELLEFQLGKA